MSGGDIRTARQAQQLLKAPLGAGPDVLRKAYRAAVRVAHPDHGGDAESLRRVIDAYRLLTDLHEARRYLTPLAPAATPSRPISLEITALEAIRGGAKAVRLPDGRAGRLTLTAGLRNGDRVRLKTPDGPLLFKIRIARGDLDIRGDHVWMTAMVSPQILEEGGRIEVDAGSGFKVVWITPDAAKRGLARLPCLGLPARGPHAQGHLFLRLELDAAEAQAATASESRARMLLRRFAAAWAA